uniref:YncE family protein n=1 Tax=Ningiella ruwaisensis TaxID=2364274 RepID=UPI001444E9C3|nr:YncE family protein [Ningiella ruwaisensis]
MKRLGLSRTRNVRHILVAMLLLILCLSTGASAKQLAVVNKSDNSVSLIDMETKQVIATLPTGQGPHELALSPDGRYAVSTDFVGGDSLSVFDLHAVKLAKRIKLDSLPGPHGIRFLSDQQVIFTSGKSQQVGIVDIQRGEIIDRIGTEQNTSHMLALNESKDFAYVSNIRSNSISKLDVQARKKIKDIATEGMPEAIAYRKTGKELWYGANEQGKVLALDASSNEVLASFDGFKFPYRILFNHDESIAIIPDFRNHDVRFIDANSKQEIGKLYLGEGAGPQGIELHPEQDIVYLSLNLKNKVIAIDLKQQKIIEEYPTGNNPDGIVFVPK